MTDPKKKPEEYDYPNWNLEIIDPHWRPVSNLKMRLHIDGKTINEITDIDGKICGLPRSERAIIVKALCKGRFEVLNDNLYIKPEDLLEGNLVTFLSPYLVVKGITQIHQGSPGIQNLVPTREKPIVRERNDDGHPEHRVLTVPEEPGSIESLLKIAETWAAAKVPYTYGGRSMTGADCSGSTWAIFQQNGMKYNQVASHGSNAAGITMNPNFVEVTDNPQPGDVVYFAKNKEYSYYHVAIYAGDGMMYTAHNSRTGEPYSLMSVVKFRKGSAPDGFYRYRKSE